MSTAPIPPVPIHQEERSNVWAGYTDQDWPLTGYAVLIGAYLAGASALAIGAAKSNRLPRRTNVSDLVLLGIATHKLTRILTKDWVRPLRAPFTRYEKSLGGGEQTDKSRGAGMQQAIGDLITCPWCSAPWVATALAGGLIFKPRMTRFVAGVFTSVAISDYLHHLWDFTRSAAQKKSK
jgi:hypothetical protein